MDFVSFLDRFTVLSRVLVHVHVLPHGYNFTVKLDDVDDIETLIEEYRFCDVVDFKLSCIDAIVKKPAYILDVYIKY